MEKVLRKVVIALMIFMCCNLANCAYSNDNDVKKQIENLSEEIRKAQRSGDEEAIKKAFAKYHQFIKENPELKNVLNSFNKFGEQILEHENKARNYFSKGDYDAALEEYKTILILINKSDFSQGLTMKRALVLVEIGKIYLKKADKVFENALAENMPTASKEFIENEINSLKEKSIENRKKNNNKKSEFLTSGH